MDQDKRSKTREALPKVAVVVAAAATGAAALAGADVGLLIAVGLAGGALWDVALATDSKRHNTISAVVSQWMRRHPVVLAGLAYLAGHLFWPVRDGWVAADTARPVLEVAERCATEDEQSKILLLAEELGRP